jgi:integrase
MEGKLLCDVLPKDIAYVMSFAVKLSESVHNKTYMLLKRISTSAYKSGFVMENPCTEMHNGGNQPEEKTALTKEQISVLLDSVAGTSTYVFCMIGLFSGLRKEEILGLNWDCVHLDGTPRIDVKRALRHPGNKPVLSTELKSAAAHRTVPIPSVLVACLRKEKESSSSQFVIKNSTNGALSKSQFNRLWNYVIRRTAKERTYYRYVDGVKTPHFIDARLGEKSKRGGYLYTIDFKVTPHILRHTYISNLLLAGVDIKTVQYLAGHEKSKTTLDIYSHLIYNRPEENLCKVNAAFSNKSTAPSLSQPTSPLQV